MLRINHSFFIKSICYTSSLNQKSICASMDSRIANLRSHRASNVAHRKARIVDIFIGQNQTDVLVLQK